MDTGKRDNRIDIIKGILIILMVWGHSSIQFGHNWLYLFHMAAFVIASGYFFRPIEERGVVTTVVKKLKGLWLPYVLCNCGFTVFAYIFHQILPEVMIETGLEGIYYQKGLYQRLLTEFLMLDLGPFGGATWFIRHLLITALLFYLSDVIVRRVCVAILRNQRDTGTGRKLGGWTRDVIHMGIGVLLLILGYVARLLFPPLSVLYNAERAFMCYILYFIGWIFHRRWRIDSSVVTRAAIGIGAFLLLCLLNPFGEVKLISAEIHHPVFFVGCGVLGWLMLWEIAYFIDRYGSVASDVISFIGRNTVWILTCHYFAFWILGLIGIENRYLQFISGVTVPLLICIIVNGVIRIIDLRMKPEEDKNLGPA